MHSDLLRYKVIYAFPAAMSPAAAIEGQRTTPFEGTPLLLLTVEIETSTTIEETSKYSQKVKIRWNTITKRKQGENQTVFHLTTTGNLFGNFFTDARILEFEISQWTHGPCLMNLAREDRAHYLVQPLIHICRRMHNVIINRFILGLGEWDATPNGRGWRPGIVCSEW